MYIDQREVEGVVRLIVRMVLVILIIYVKLGVKRLMDKKNKLSGVIGV